ncbi:MAG: phosphoserine aminotransferase, partial [Alphaproteobacteria bacterium HGW-Alphaproteobacteria-2]
IEGTREVLQVPADYRIGIVPASDTGAVEMAMWTMLGPRPVEMLAWESFGAGWVSDAVRQLRLDAKLHEAPYGALPDLSAVNCDNDVVFTWNGTTSGVRVPDGDWIAAERKGITICDATSAAFAQHLPWDRLDVTTFSWQKVLGGEAAHGMIILSPRAVERLESYPSMLAVEDYLLALDWARSIGGLDALRERANANLAVIERFVAENAWLAFLAQDPATRSNTSVCLTFADPAIADGAAFARAVAKRLEAEGVAWDIGAYRDAPPGLRIWCGATVERADIEALMPWIGWAYRAEIAALAETV